VCHICLHCRVSRVLPGTITSVRFRFICKLSYITEVEIGVVGEYTSSMSKLQNVELLVNTHSRRGKEALPIVVEACKTAGIKLARIHKVKDPSRLPRILEGVRDRSPDLLIVGSGDGTVSDVVDYLANTTIALGFVPLGTTNNFARSLGVPLDIVTAVHRIKNGSVHHIDLGLADDDHFANVAGIGLSAELANGVTPKLKRRYGRLAYLITGLKVLWGHKPFRVTVADKDGELQMHFETHQVIIANGRFHAGREIAAGARLNSRELVVFKLGGSSRLSLAWHMIDFYFGPRRNVSHSSYLIAKDISIITSSPQPVELDGEVKLRTPLQVKVRQRAVKVLY
jgi:diacylglycerol kinase (ATP)